MERKVADTHEQQPPNTKDRMSTHSPAADSRKPRRSGRSSIAESRCDGELKTERRLDHRGMQRLAVCVRLLVGDGSVRKAVS
jgi:hypothetical protein